MLSSDRGIIALVHAWLDVSVLLSVVVDFLDILRLEIRKAKALEDTGFVDLVDAGKRFRNGD